MKVGLDEVRSLIQAELANQGLRDVQHVDGGKQNYVYTYSVNDECRIVKVTDSRHRTLAALLNQSEMLEALKTINPLVCAPIEIKDGLSNLVLDIGGVGFFAISYPFVKGETADIKNPAHISLIGKSLATLHKDMRKLKNYPFLAMTEVGKRLEIHHLAQTLSGAELAFNNATRHFGNSDRQLLHGDFNVGNLKINGKHVGIFDFDNCLYGSVAYELANSLYMILFDQVTQGKISVYKEFKREFLKAYLTETEAYIDPETIDDLIGYRVLVLASWLAHPSDAPLFIRQSPQTWLNTLNRFVKTYFEKITLLNGRA